MTKIIYGKRTFRDGNDIHVSAADFEPPPVDTESIKMSIDLLNEISRTELGGRKVCELFMYEDIPIWWFCYKRLASYFVSTIGFIDNLARFVEEHRPDEIRVEDDFSKLLIIEQICSAGGVRLSCPALRRARFNMQERSRRVGKRQVVKVVTRKKINARITLFDGLQIPPLADRILFATYSTYRRPIYDPETHQSPHGEFIMDGITRLLDTEMIGLDMFSKVMSDDHALKKRLGEKRPWLPAEALFRSDPPGSHAEFLHDFKKIIESESFLDLFEFRGIRFGRHLLPFLQEFLLDCYLPYWLNLSDSFYKALSRSRPRAVFIVYETAPASLALISACRRLGIKTVGLQHGIIHSSHYLYMHDEVYSAKGGRHGFIIPDHLLLFGEMTRDSLVRCGYPSESLVAFCNVALLDIMNARDHRDQIRGRHHLPKDRKIVLFAPPGLSDYAKGGRNYNKEVLERLLRAGGSFLLIVKPHPVDDPSFYADILNRHKEADAQMIDADIAELIAASDVLISTFSTTMIDAMCLDVPVIQARVPGVSYARPYDGTGAVLPVPPEDLAGSVESLLDDEPAQEKLRRSGRRFAKQYYNLPIEDPRSILEDILKA